MAVPNIFGSATSAIPLSQLDTNFATAITLGNTAVYLGNTTTSLGNVTLTNVTISSGNVTITGANVSGTANVSTLVVTGNQTFVGTGNRITGDFSNATITNRVAFQSSTTNGVSDVNVLPNGTSSVSAIRLNNNSDPTNAGICRLFVSDTVATIDSNRNSGSGTYLPMTLNTGGSERVRVDTSGNVGIGTNSPAEKLQVAGTTKIGVTGTNGVLSLARTSDGATITNFKTDGTSGIIDSAISTTFQINTVEAMRIDSSGNLLVGTTSVYSAPKMAVAFTSAVNNGLVFYQTNNSTGTFINFFSNSTTQQGSIINNNNGTVNYANASDYRLKENIVDFDENGLNLISRVKVRKFNRKEYPDATITGFIAHELAEVCPQAVCGEKDAVNEDGSIKAQSVDQSYLVPFLVKAIQEQQALILSLTTRITALEAK